MSAKMHNYEISFLDDYVIVECVNVSAPGIISAITLASVRNPSFEGWEQGFGHSINIRVSE